MGKNSSASAFDEILSKFASEEDKNAFVGLAEKYPDLKSYGLRQSDYSRFMNENGEKLRELEDWHKWRDEYYVQDPENPKVGWTKKELELKTQLEATQAEKDRLAELVEFGGEGEMTFEELERFGKTLIEKNGLVSQDVLVRERDGLIAKQQFLTRAAVRIPYLNRQHEKEFGDQFDPDDLLQKANAAGAVDIDSFYKQYIQDDKIKKLKEDNEATVKRLQEEKDQAVAKAKQEADAANERLKGMSVNGSPTDLGVASMSPLKKAILGIKDDQSVTATGTITEGGGSLAAQAAAVMRETGHV